MSVYGGIETGGSKWECAIGTGPEDVRAQASIPTTTPSETIDGSRSRSSSARGPSTRSASARSARSTRNCPRRPGASSPPHPSQAGRTPTSARKVRRRLMVPVGFDTDVNAAALGEHRWGAAHGLDTFCYITVGTGIGGGGMDERQAPRRPFAPRVRPRPRSHTDAKSIRSTVSAPTTATAGKGSHRAVRSRRAGAARAEELASDDRVWALEARYLALGLVSCHLALDP